MQAWSSLDRPDWGEGHASRLGNHVSAVLLGLWRPRSGACSGHVGQQRNRRSPQRPPAQRLLQCAGSDSATATTDAVMPTARPANVQLWPPHRLLCLEADLDDTNRRCGKSRDRTGGSEVMPLSEREQRLLDQIERALQAENPNSPRPSAAAIGISRAAFAS